MREGERAVPSGKEKLLCQILGPSFISLCPHEEVEDPQLRGVTIEMFVKLGDASRKGSKDNWLGVRS